MWARMAVVESSSVEAFASLKPPRTAVRRRSKDALSTALADHADHGLNPGL